MRSLGIPILEYKIVQGALVIILQSIYKEDFLTGRNPNNDSLKQYIFKFIYPFKKFVIHIFNELRLHLLIIILL